MKKFEPLLVIKDNTDPTGDTIIIDPYDDFPDWVPSEDLFEIDELVELRIPAGDNSLWAANGVIVDIVLDDGMESPILIVKIKWETAAPLLHEPVQ